MTRKHFAIGSGAVASVVAAIAAFMLTTGEPDWGLHIVVFSVGQADAVAIVEPGGQACLIDAGKNSTGGRRIAGFFKDPEQNGVGKITHIKMGFATHYDSDHIGAFDTLAEEGITFGAVYDQGPSLKRYKKVTHEDGTETLEPKTMYGEYLATVGDPNDNMEQDPGETGFVRKLAKRGVRWKLGENGAVRCLSARGDTKGSEHDHDLDPSKKKLNENPGSVALLISLGEFEFYSAGDQTSDDWKREEDTEIAVVKSGVLGDETDVDVLKVNHHGSDTSTGREFIRALDPEVAIITSTYHSGHKLPKMVAVKQLAEDQVLVYVTGDGRDPDTGTFAISGSTEDDDGYTPHPDNIINDAGDVHIFVSRDGLSYKVIYDDGGADEAKWRKFSSLDADNARTQ